MKKILGLAVAALLVMTLVGSGTWAYFSDTETSADNTLVAGTLDLNINGGNAAVYTFQVSNKAPGDSGSGSSTLANEGSLDGELDVELTDVTNTPGEDGEFGSGDGELGANTEIAIYIDVNQNGNWNNGDIGLKWNGNTYSHPTDLDYAPIDDYADAIWDAVETMAPSAPDDIIILWRIPAEVDNEIQGDSVTFDVIFTIEQAEAD